VEGVSGGPVSDDNAFVWNVTIFGPEGTIYEEGMFRIEFVFCEDPSEIPRIRFLTPMFHPNISPAGHPWFSIITGKHDSMVFYLHSLKKLLVNEPSPSPATWINEEAAKLYFSKDPDGRAQWKKKARTLARRSVEEAIP
jgi:ubiquitin-protein ligase